MSSRIKCLTNPRSIAKIDKLFKRDWDIVFLVYDLIRFNAEKLFSTDADVGGKDKIVYINSIISLILDVSPKINLSEYRTCNSRLNFSALKVLL